MKNAKTRNAYKIWVANFDGRGKYGPVALSGRKTLITKYVAKLRFGHCEVLYTGSGSISWLFWSWFAWSFGAVPLASRKGNGGSDGGLELKLHPFLTSTLVKLRRFHVDVNCSIILPT